MSGGLEEKIKTGGRGGSRLRQGAAGCCLVEIGFRFRFRFRVVFF